MGLSVGSSIIKDIREECYMVTLGLVFCFCWVSHFNKPRGDYANSMPTFQTQFIAFEMPLTVRHPLVCKDIGLGYRAVDGLDAS